MSSATPATGTTAARHALRRWIPAAVIAAFIVLPAHAILMDNAFALALMSRIVILAIAAVALNLVLGYGGMVSFGHALFLGLGVYSAAIPAVHGVESAIAHLLIAILACGLTGFITGAIALRTQGIAFIMITLAFAQMFYFVFVSLSPYGGDDGMRLASGSQSAGVNLTDPAWLYAASLAILLGSLYGMRRLVSSRFGMALQGSRINDARMRALGFSTVRYRLAAYVISAMLCGVAGVLYANLTQFAAPSYMSWAMSGELIVMVVLGGMGSIMGPLYGAAALLLTEEALKSVTEHWMLILGPAIVAVAVTSRHGLAGLLAARAQPQAEVSLAHANASTLPAQPACSPARLVVSNLVKRYGGLLATDHVNLELETGRIHVVIGPNGAGKSTLIGQLSGEITPDNGTIEMDGRDITRSPVHVRSLSGLKRSYQITSVLPQFTALENVMLAVQAHEGHSFRFWQPAHQQDTLRLPALAALQEAGLQEHAHTLASALAHGQQRQLELAMVLAVQPRVLLLDEPMAGMSQAESRHMTNVLQRLRPHYAILLVEHDMEAVFSLADQISVLVYGRCIATGSPEDIRNNEEVRQAYLGEEA
ncbi:MAG: branched-chain amino acid ABC transporter ATP-binding protein/permease [Alcaligenaceae bacterium]|nr:branched-chain amino acid ABC transporter ATP-binding protein/permease [Alcaligenaceae bacterium]